MKTKTTEIEWDVKNRDMKILHAIILNVEALSQDFSGQFKQNIFEFLEKKILELENPESHQIDNYSKKIHTTIGVYKNGDYKINGVMNCNLILHIRYNLDFRFGRALFVDGTCINKGYLTDEEVIEWAAKIRNNPIYFRTKDTQPYV